MPFKSKKSRAQQFNVGKMLKGDNGQFLQKKDNIDSSSDESIYSINEIIYLNDEAEEETYEQFKADIKGEKPWAKPGNCCGVRGAGNSKETFRRNNNKREET